MHPRVRAQIQAAGNHGVIDRRRALAHGMTDRGIEHLVQTGQWRRLHPRAFVPAGVPIEWATRLAAATAWGGPDSLLSHRTAGELLELDGVPSGFVELVCHSGRSAHGITVHRLRAEDRPRRHHVKGFAITTVDRTLLDLFAVLPARDASLALEDALRKKMTTIDRLWECYGQLAKPGRNGCRALRHDLLKRDSADGKLASRMEALLLSIVKSIPPPMAIPQFEVETEGRRYYLDFAYPHVKLGLEAHSIRWHLGAEKAKRDLARDRRLKRCGWTLLYYPWDDLRFSADEVRAEIIDVRTKLERRLL